LKRRFRAYITKFAPRQKWYHDEIGPANGGIERVSRTNWGTSPPVVDELERGGFPNREECLRLIAPLALLAVEPPVLEIVQAYIAHQVMPRSPAGENEAILRSHLTWAILLSCQDWNTRPHA
jgi:hypothetical protein